MSEAYWTSEKGITVRLADLAEHIAYRTYNKAIQVYGVNNGIKKFFPVGMIDENTCDYCYAVLTRGKPYRVGQFMPTFPAHNGCRCMWDVFVEELAA